MPLSPIVVKVGGSLFDLADLGERLRCWLPTLTPSRVLLVPGGGVPADVIRRYDQLHRLGDEAAHWLALRAMSLQAEVLAALLREADVVADCRQAATTWRRERLAILDAHAFLRADEARAGTLPHSWDVTSDSVAARAAMLLHARELILLKSTAQAEDLLDRHFKTMPLRCAVRVIDFRSATVSPQSEGRN